MLFHTILLNIFIAHLFTETRGEDKIEPKHTSLSDRLGLYSLYSMIPLTSEFDQYVDYQLIFHFTNMSESELYKGKIMEIDSLGWLNGKQTIHHKLPYFIANPSLRVPHISKEWCDSKDFFNLGFRIHQTTRELGLPYQVKCATCHPIIEGLNNIYYLFPERDFTQMLTKLSIGTRMLDNHLDYCNLKDCEQNPRVADFQKYLISNDLDFGKWTRWSGEHATNEENREIMGTPNGELAIHSRSSDGFTTMCGMELNGNVVSSNIFVNGDVVGPDNGGLFTYQNYESLVITVNSTKDNNLNLELFVSWDNWGCCSACCCPAAICGHEFQTTSSECENLFSSRARTGHLSVRMINRETTNSKDQSLLELHKLLSIPPYTYRGIPVFSSLLKKPILKFSTDKIKEIMIPKFVEDNKNKRYEFSSGMFVESESCKSNIQKTDCLEWARCHNISLAESDVESSENVADACQLVHFVDVLVGTEHMKVTVGEHQNLRIRMDSEVHDMKKIKAKWRVNLRKPKKYDKRRPCLLQGVVQRDDEILILNFAAFDLKIDLILGDEKVRITFVNARAFENDRVVKYSIFYWALAIVAFFLLLIAAVIFMHREKTRRLERVIKSVTE